MEGEGSWAARLGMDVSLWGPEEVILGCWRAAPWCPSTECLLDVQLGATVRAGALLQQPAPLGVTCRTLRTGKADVQTLAVCVAMGNVPSPLSEAVGERLALCLEQSLVIFSPHLQATDRGLWRYGGKRGERLGVRFCVGPQVKNSDATVHWEVT